MKITPHKLRDIRLSGWHDRIAGCWHYRDLAADPTWYHGWISFDAVTAHPEDGLIYCGLNFLDGDLLYRFDPATGHFGGLNTRRWTDAFESKIHRTLLVNPLDGSLVFGTSLLHDADQQHLAPGGKLVRYDPKKDHYEILGIPFPSPLFTVQVECAVKPGSFVGLSVPAISRIWDPLPIRHRTTNPPASTNFVWEWMVRSTWPRMTITYGRAICGQRISNPIPISQRRDRQVLGWVGQVD